jgi:hypothetical protein
VALKLPCGAEMPVVVSQILQLVGSFFPGASRT